jgi:hypothetical protein
MRASWNGAWICCGDFNEVLSQDEHVGPRDRTEGQIAAFRDCLQDCGFSDLGFEGPKFTWTNRQDADQHVKVRLDRAVANGDFMHRFEDCTVENVITTSSDHYAIAISFVKRSARGAAPSVSQSFRYEAMWRKAPDYVDTMEAAWLAGREGSLSPINLEQPGPVGNYSEGLEPNDFWVGPKSDSSA